MKGHVTRQSWLVGAFVVVALAIGLSAIVSSTAWGANIVRQGRSLYYHYIAQDGHEVRFVRQLVTGDMKHSRIIMWEKDNPEQAPVVLYKEANASDGTIQTVPATMETLKEDQAVRYIYRAELTQLEPDKVYKYQVGKNIMTDEWHTLQTVEYRNFTALIFPDSQSANYNGWRELVHTAYKENPEAAFFVNMGDLVDNGESASQWDAWFEAVEPMISDIPLSSVIGNHEYYSLDWKIKEPTAYDAFFKFDAPTVTPYSSHVGDSSRRGFYSYDYGDVHFVVLNTQFEEMNEAYRDALQTEQVAWLKQDLANTKQPWKVILMHRDSFRYPHTKAPHIEPGINKIGEVFMPIFDQYKVDLVLSAHYHMYRRRGHVENFQRSVTGPYYIITGVAGDVKYANIWLNHPLDEYKSPYLEADNYLVLHKQENSLTIDAYLADGTQFDTVTLTK